MGVFQKIKDFFMRGGAKLGMTKSLSKITDDSRIAMPAKEYTRIARAKEYYANDAKKVSFRNSYGDKRWRQFRSLGITKMASRRLASLIFNEQCTIAISGNKEAQALIDRVFEDNYFNLSFEDYLEKGIALGSGCIRPYVDEHDKIKLSWATADNVYPLNVNTNEVNEVALAFPTMQVEHNRNIYYTLLEFHQWNPDGTYKITNELYRSSDSNKIGNQVPLNTLEQYQGLSETINIGSVDSNGQPTKALKKPLFAFYKNPGSNNKELISPMGLGIADNVLNIVDAINETFDGFVIEVKTGHRRIVVPKSWLMRQSDGRTRRGKSDPHPRMFDPDEIVYQAGYGDDNTIGFHDMTSDLRGDEYSGVLNDFLRQFESEVGFSPGTFTVSPSGIQTATEVVSNNSMTYQTRSSYLTMAEKTIKALVDAILEVAQCGQFFSDGRPRCNGDIDDVDTKVNFNDGVFVDQNQQQQMDGQAVSLGAMPLTEYIKRNYNVDDEVAQEWFEKRQQELGQPAPDGEVGLYAGGDTDDNTRQDVEEG